jgi:hypothetical protein
MFDANAAYIRKGKKFFVDIHNVSDRLREKGIIKGSVVYCHMLNESNENPCVDMLVKGKMLTVCGGNDEDYYDNWFVYAGKPDGSDFIHEKSRNKAMLIIAGIEQLSEVA